MNGNFFQLVRDAGLEIVPIDRAPTSPGFYFLFADQGEFIYVGKADDLHDRLGRHFGDDEENNRIKGIAKYAIWQTTQTVTQAEDAEGYLYDSWVRSTGTPPFANRNKPPKSKLTDDQILAAKLKQIMSEYSTLARRQ
jgi:excinuclease UvrABC nuclease subunit